MLNASCSIVPKAVTSALFFQALWCEAIWTASSLRLGMLLPSGLHMGCTRPQHKDKIVVYLWTQNRIHLVAWCPSPASPFHTWLGWGLYQPHYWQESLVLWFLYEKNLAYSQTSMFKHFKKTAGTAAILPTTGLKGGNLKKPDLLSAIFWKLYWLCSEDGLQIQLTMPRLCSYLSSIPQKS